MKLDDPKYWDMLIKRGLSRFFMLCVLHRKPLHGYDLTRQVKDCSCYCCSPTPGSIYPLLQELIRTKFVTVKLESVAGRARKVYKLTARGEKAYQTAVRSWQNILPGIIQACKGVK